MVAIGSGKHGVLEGGKDTDLSGGTVCKTLLQSRLISGTMESSEPRDFQFSDVARRPTRERPLGVCPVVPEWVGGGQGGTVQPPQQGQGQTAVVLPWPRVTVSAFWPEPGHHSPRRDGPLHTLHQPGSLCEDDYHSHILCSTEYLFVT